MLHVSIGCVRIFGIISGTYLIRSSVEDEDDDNSSDLKTNLIFFELNELERSQ